MTAISAFPALRLTAIPRRTYQGLLGRDFGGGAPFPFSKGTAHPPNPKPRGKVSEGNLVRGTRGGCRPQGSPQLPWRPRRVSGFFCNGELGAPGLGMVSKDLEERDEARFFFFWSDRFLNLAHGDDVALFRIDLVWL